MAAAIRVELSETALAVSPGGAVTARCTVYNSSIIVDEYQMQVSGLDPAWLQYPEMTTRIFPEAIETLAITFQPPRSAAISAGDYEFTVTATSSSPDYPGLSASASGILTIDPFVDFGLDLISPRQVTSETAGEFRIQLTNTGNSTLEIALDTAEETGQLDLAFSSPTVSIQGNESQTVTLTARPGEQHLGSAASYQIAIGAQVVSAAGAPAASSDRRMLQVMFQTLPSVVEPPTLAPQRIELSGQHAETHLVIRNRSAIPMSMSLMASDKAHALAFEFVGGDQISVPAQDSLRVPIRITCLDRTLLAPAPAPTAFTVTATPIHPAGEPRVAYGELALPSPADFRLRLEPEIIESTTNERAQLTIENVSGRAGSFTLLATSKDTSLSVSLGATQVEVGAHESVTLPVELVPDVEKMAAGAPGKSSGFSIRVASVEMPSHSNEAAGQYLFTPPSITVQLKKKEIESVSEATFEIEIENGGKNEVAVALSASDRTGSCTYEFDLPRVRIASRSTALVRLTVKPPVEHRSDARWEFVVVAKPVSPPGAAISDAGVLIYRTPSVALALWPAERRGRRSRKYDISVTNPTNQPMVVKLTARDHSGGLRVGVKRDTVNLPPSGTLKVPLKVSPWKRTRGSGEAALAFTVAANPISPPGDATTTEGRFVVLPARSRLIYLALLLLIFIVLLNTPLYAQAFYLAGWEKHFHAPVLDDDGKPTLDANGNPRLEIEESSGKHTIRGDISCIVRRAVEGDAKEIRNRCFAQGIKPKTANSDR